MRTLKQGHELCRIHLKTFIIFSVRYLEGFNKLKNVMNCVYINLEF